MRFRSLFEFKAKENMSTEDEILRKASLAVVKLRNFCKKLGGDFMAHSPHSATCWLPEPTDVSLVRVGKGVIGAISDNRPYVEIFFEELPDVFEVKADKGAIVEIYSEPLKSSDFAKLASGGGEIRNLKVKTISVRTDPTESHIHIDLF